MDDMVRDPAFGIGKPEHLRYRINHSWSRPITEEHRLVYQVMDKAIIILQTCYRCRT
ncbi:Txe/YoeB family addiction module toxin [Ferrimicrobium sp.]|uniref:Txe/YoeB family addiction module toxin n=1 Tax=Ferrimicrobium sp. TaxID=2926050 RepID=UPI00344DD760